MKVYLNYEIPEFQNSIEAIDSLAQVVMRANMEKHKYRTMWQLRSLEKEIDEEGGMIIIHDKGGIQTKGFSRELTDKITVILKADLD